MKKRRPGEVRDAIFSYFDKHNSETVSLSALGEHVRSLLGDVAPSSIRSFMNLSDDFERVGRGEYRRRVR